MPTTFKERLSLIKIQLDSLFSNARADDKTDIIKDLRDYLSLQNAAGKRPSYDRKSSPGDSTQDH